MKCLVDTDWVIDYLTGQPTAQQLFASLLPDGIAISVVSFSEIYEGIYGSRDPKQAERAFRALLRRVTVLGASRAVAKRNAQIWNELRRRHRPIMHRAFDLLIAATALEHDLSLATRNVSDYQDIAGLKVYQTS